MKTKTTTLFTDVYRKGALLALLLHILFAFLSTIESYGQVKISAMPETKEDPAGGWIPVVLSNKNYKYNPGSYVQQRTIESIRGLSPTNLPADYVYYVTDLGKEGFFRYDASDVDKPNDNPPTKASVDDGATVLVTKNNLRFKRIIENNTVNAKWFEMGSDPAAVINTLKYRNNTVITYAQAQAIFDRATASRATLSQTDFTTQTATWFALQRAINFCLASGNKLYIPAGQYTVSKGLLVADLGNYISGFEIQGAATTYNGSASQTVLNFTNKENFGIGFHRVKGLRVRNLFLKGQDKVNLKNNDQDPVTLYDYFENPDMDWTHGCRDHVWSPHAGFVVDPFFNQGQGGEAEMYPGFTSFYTDPDGSGGSTDVIFDNCRVEQFVVGYCFSPHAAPQNGDNIAVNNSWVNYCKSGISVGQSQNRSVAVNNLKCWGGVETLFDSQRYADGTADNVEVDELQIAGGVKFLARIGQWPSKGLQIRRMHAELLYSLGGSFEFYPNNSKLIIEDSWIDFAGERPEENIHAARSAFHGDRLRVKDSFFGQYLGANSLPQVINARFAKFENCSFYAGVINLGTPGLEVKETKLVDCVDDKGYGHNSAELGPRGYQFINSDDEWQMNRYSSTSITAPYRRIPTQAVPFTGVQNANVFGLSQSVSLTEINNTTMEAAFNLPVNSIDFNSVSTGDVFYTGDAVPNEFGTNSGFILGRVKSKDSATGKIKLELVAKGISTGTPYSITIARSLQILTSFIMGSTTTGSNVISNIVQESSAFWDWSGQTIISPFFPAGTIILSVDEASKTFTMSNKATASINGMEVICADWNAIEYGPGPSSVQNGYGFQAYKKGDIVYNNDIVKYPDVEKWVCVKSGFLGWPSPAPYVAEFTTYFKSTSNTLTANSTLEIAEGRLVTSIIVRPTVALTAFKIGTTPGGNDVLANTSVAANADKIINLNRYFRNKTTLYFSGIAGSVEIIIPK